MENSQLKPLTNEKCIQYIKSYLLANKIKPHQIEVSEDLITFEHKNTVYSVFIEGYEDIHYGVHEMDGVEVGSSFWRDKDEFGDYEYIDQFFETIVKERYYEYVRKTWKTLDNLYDNDETDDLRQIVSEYFGMPQ